MVYRYVEDKPRKETKAQRSSRTISLNFHDLILSQHQNVGEQETYIDAFTSHHYSLIPTPWPLKPLRLLPKRCISFHIERQRQSQAVPTSEQHILSAESQLCSELSSRVFHRGFRGPLAIELYCPRFDVFESELSWLTSTAVSVLKREDS